jgi:segregation and condensation protein B
MSLPPVATNPSSLLTQVESILYAAGEPASISTLAVALDASPQDVESALEDLSVLCMSRGVRVQRNGNEVQLVTAPETAEKIQKFLGLEATNRLSTAALETLAIIAYKQPITKPQIEMIRGVNCDGVMKTLELHNLVKEFGRAETVGHPMRYGVSFDFLQHFGLRGVFELPSIDKLDVLPTTDDALNGDNPTAADDISANPFSDVNNSVSSEGEESIISSIAMGTELTNPVTELNETSSISEPVVPHGPQQSEG